MAVVYIGVGSNIRPQENILSALETLKPYMPVTGTSTFFRTPPIGKNGGKGTQPFFINGVWRIRTNRPPREIKFSILRGIESDLGRVRSGDKYSPRPIDLDLLLYDKAVLNEPDLVLPDRDIRSRQFIIVPLLELNGNLVLPDNNDRLASYKTEPEPGQLTPLPEFTLELKRRIDHE